MINHVPLEFAKVNKLEVYRILSVNFVARHTIYTADVCACVFVICTNVLKFIAF